MGEASLPPELAYAFRKTGLILVAELGLGEPLTVQHFGPWPQGVVPARHVLGLVRIAPEVHRYTAVGVLLRRYVVDRDRTLGRFVENLCRDDATQRLVIGFGYRRRSHFMSLQSLRQWRSLLKS